jgi:citrate synthase
MDIPQAAKTLFSALETLKTRGANIEIMASLVQTLSLFKAELAGEYRANSELRTLLSEVIEHRPDMRTFVSRVMDGFGNGEHSSIALMIWLQSLTKSKGRPSLL